jgi:hypothetical protein
MTLEQFDRTHRFDRISKLLPSGNTVSVAVRPQNLGLKYVNEEKQWLVDITVDANVRDEDAGDEGVEDEDVGDEGLRDEDVGDESLRDESLRDEDVGDEGLRDEDVGDEDLRDEDLRDEDIRDEGAFRKFARNMAYDHLRYFP